MADVTIRRDENLLCGRLVALPSTTTTDQLWDIQNSTAGFQNAISIDFPAMPDSIELARSAEYYVNSNIVMPDGIHQYKGTKPLEIPISFKLHSFDKDYCKQGAFTLLQLAARLHAFVLPISTLTGRVELAPKAASTDQTDGQANNAVLEHEAGTTKVYEVATPRQHGRGIFNPVTCWLHLMWLSNAQPGISAVGYVREVKVVFNGPWLRGPNNAFNLPSSADFSFVFVHRPGHGNNTPVVSSQFPPTVSRSGQAFADDVKDLFYNTRALVWAANYQGFATDPASALSGNAPPITSDIQEQQKTEPLPKWLLPNGREVQPNPVPEIIIFG